MNMTQDKEELIELYEAFSIEEIEERLELERTPNMVLVNAL